MPRPRWLDMTAYTLAKQIDRSDTEIYNICKLQYTVLMSCIKLIHKRLKIYCLRSFRLNRQAWWGGWNAYRTTRRQTNSRSVKSRTGQLADNEFLKNMELLYVICTLNLTLTLTLTLSNTGSVHMYKQSNLSDITLRAIIYCKF